MKVLVCVMAILLPAAPMADAACWGWLPALSGVAVGADLARAKYAETLPDGSGLSG